MSCTMPVILMTTAVDVTSFNCRCSHSFPYRRKQCACEYLLAGTDEMSSLLRGSARAITHMQVMPLLMSIAPGSAAGNVWQHIACCLCNEWYGLLITLSPSIILSRISFLLFSLMFLFWSQKTFHGDDRHMTKQFRSLLEIPDFLQLLRTMTRSHKPISVFKPVYAIKINTKSLGRLLKYKYWEAWVFIR